MARLAVSLAGAVAGSVLVPGGIAALGLSGAGLGFAAGSIAGALLFPATAPDVSTQGPRLSDQLVTSSAYGQILPLVYGTISVAGNIIDASEYYESEQTETETQGKGGGGQEVSHTTYTYSIDLAVSLTGRPIKGVTAIFANEQLIYDVRPGSTVKQHDWLELKVYTGSETQEPDPTLEAIHGAGNVPGYRGVSYVVFTNFQLAGFSNSIPSFRFIVATEGSDTATEEKIETGNTGVTNGVVYDDRTGLLYTAMKASVSDHYYEADALVAIDPLSRRIVWDATGQYPGGLGLHQARHPQLTGTIESDEVGRDVVVPVVAIAGRQMATGKNHRIGLYDAHSGQCYGVSDLSITIDATPNDLWMASLYTDQLHFQTFRYGGVPPYNHCTRFIYTKAATEDGRYTLTRPSGYSWQNTGQVIGCRKGSKLNKTYALVMLPVKNSSSSVVGVAQYDDQSYTSPDYIISEFDTDVESCKQIYWDDVGQKWWVFIIKYTPSTIRFYEVTTAGLVTKRDWVTDYANTEESKDGHYRFAHDWVNGYIWLVTDGSFVYKWDIRNLTAPEKMPSTNIEKDVAWVDSASSLFGTKSNDIYNYFPDQITPSVVTLASVVDDLCNRASLEPSDYATSELTSNVNGFVIGNQMSARSALDSLRKIYLFDHADDGSQIAFKHLGQSVARALDIEDIGASIESDQSAGILDIHREQEINLPKEVIVNYLDINRDYSTGTQRARRLATKSTHSTQINMPIALTDTEAAHIADVLIHLAHTEREHYELSAMPVHMDLIPTDVVTVDTGSRQVRLRITEKTYEGGAIRLRGLRDESSVLTSVQTGISAVGRYSSVTSLGLMQAWLMGLPSLRDEDIYTAGFYVAGFSYTDDWPGGNLYRSLDGTTYNRVASVQNGTLGYVENAAGSGVLWRWDRSTTLTVRIITDGTLSSVTDADVIAGANAAAWGVNGRWEIIQFATATLGADGTYTLSDLLRGRYGTEQYVGDHETQDRFVLLGTFDVPQIQRANAETSDIGKIATYRGVTFGRRENDGLAIEQLYTHDGRSLKPWTPTNVKSTRDGSDNITVTFDRRSRLMARAFWNPGLAEDSESYEIDILDGVSVVRTITSSTTTASYTAAEQTTDGLTPGNPVDLIVYQISATVGRGFGAEATV